MMINNLTTSLELQNNLPGRQFRAVAVFRIKFRPNGDSIRFRFVFGSEEYPEFSCSKYNDLIPNGFPAVDKNVREK